MELFKKIFNGLLRAKWFWLLSSLVNAAGVLVAMARNDMDWAQHCVIGAVVYFVFSLVGERFVLK